MCKCPMFGVWFQWRDLSPIAQIMQYVFNFDPKVSIIHIFGALTLSVDFGIIDYRPHVGYLAPRGVFVVSTVGWTTAQHCFLAGTGPNDYQYHGPPFPI